jgi:hypothetical protein
VARRCLDQANEIERLTVILCQRRVNFDPGGMPRRGQYSRAADNFEVLLPVAWVRDVASERDTMQFGPTQDGTVGRTAWGERCCTTCIQLQQPACGLGRRVRRHSHVGSWRTACRRVVAAVRVRGIGPHGICEGPAVRWTTLAALVRPARPWVPGPLERRTWFLCWASGGEEGDLWGLSNCSTGA